MGFQKHYPVHSKVLGHSYTFTCTSKSDCWGQKRVEILAMGHGHPPSPQAALQQWTWLLPGSAAASCPVWRARGPSAAPPTDRSGSCRSSGQAAKTWAQETNVIELRQKYYRCFNENSEDNVCSFTISRQKWAINSILYNRIKYFVVICCFVVSTTVETGETIWSQDSEIPNMHVSQHKFHWYICQYRPTTLWSILIHIQFSAI